MTKTYKIRFFAIFIAIMLTVVTLTMAVSADEKFGFDETMASGQTKYVTVAEYDYTTHTERTYQMSYTEYEFTSIGPELEMLDITESPIETYAFNEETDFVGNLIMANEYSNYPYSAVCSVARVNSTARSTAFIVGKRIVMTCAHCVYDGESATWKGDTYVMPHAPGNSSSSYIINNGTKVLKAIIPTAYKTNDTVSNDWAILIVEDDVGTANGVLPLNFSAPAVNNSIYVLGYPGTAIQNGVTYRNYMFCSAGSNTSVTANYIRFTCDIRGGNSGSPVIWETIVNGTVKYNVIAIAAGSAATYNTGHRIDQFLLQAVRQLNATYQ